MPGATGKQSGTRRAAAATKKSVTKKSVTKKSVTKKAVTKKAVTKKAPATKVVTKKTVTKAPVKKAVTKKTVKKAPVKKAVTKKAPVKKATTKKATTTKVVAKKVVAKKAAAATPPAKTPPAKKVPVKKTVTCELSGFEVMPGKANLSPKTLERLRKKLLEEQERLQGQADELAAEAEALARDREGGDTQFDEESGEGDTVNVERERDLLLSASARQVVDEITEALVRMKKGTYGVCTPAGRKLPLERLEAIPWANVCVDCKARAERRR
jgi:RNA polymerase-binding transcription factor DksA